MEAEAAKERMAETFELITSKIERRKDTVSTPTVQSPLPCPVQASRQQMETTTAAAAAAVGLKGLGQLQTVWLVARGKQPCG
jgi:hypothetical protein